ncbi:DUF3800 domain-containing protein [bacterium 1xD8-6]|nr:DUF3800 domain-containing protein [bacterium D16-36]RKI63525.1 DUF3800 domain-containing protein [bacterium 1xD8-6]
MTKEYYLFLDETKPNAHGNYFALGGYAILKEDYENILSPELSSLKHRLMPDPNLPLHLYDMRKNINGFEFLSDNNIRTELFGEIEKLINKLEIYVFVASIDVSKYKKIYYNRINDIYDITLQTILENFVHFLTEKNAIGSFYIESRNTNENKFLQICYYRLLTGGTLYINSKTIMDRLSILSFPLKSDNNLGVQLADFIPISFIRHIINAKDYYNLYETFAKKVYKGYNENMQERFGFKKLLD